MISRTGAKRQLTLVTAVSRSASDNKKAKTCQLNHSRTSVPPSQPSSSLAVVFIIDKAVGVADQCEGKGSGINIRSDEFGEENDGWDTVDESGGESDGWNTVDKPGGESDGYNSDESGNNGDESDGSSSTSDEPQGEYDDLVSTLYDPPSISTSTASSSSSCDTECCYRNSNDGPYQLKVCYDNITRRVQSKNPRYFNPVWYNSFKWLSFCVTINKVFCFFCRLAILLNLVSLKNDRRIQQLEKCFI